MHLSTEDLDEAVRRKSIYALSSEIRNYQPGLDEAIKVMLDSIKPKGRVDAGDMGAVDQIIDSLRDNYKNKAP